MYLFDRQQDNIEIYSINPIPSKIMDFKEQEMAKIPSKERFYRIETNSKDNLAFKTEFPLNNDATPIDIDYNTFIINKKRSFGYEYHNLIAEKKLFDIDSNLKAFLNGEYDCSQIVRVFEYDSDNSRIKFIYYLLLNQYYQYYTNKKARIDNICNIPESLYLLELIRRGHYTLLENKDITEQLSLFSISESPIKTYELQELHELDIFGISNNTVDAALQKVEECQSIFTRIRK